MLDFPATSNGKAAPCTPRSGKILVRGRCRVGRLNLEGDGQGDLAGHGGEQRAVFVYQIESYRYWQEQLGRADFVHGQFGENFTIEGLPDDVVCIGDRYQIGSALFEVTQPRVTCYRVGIRMNEPRMPALLTSSGRPGVLLARAAGRRSWLRRRNRKGGRSEGANDRRRDQRAPLFARSCPRSAGARLADRGAFARMALIVRGDAAEPTTGGSGNAGLAPAAAAHPAAPGFRPLVVTAIDQESADVLSLTMQSRTVSRCRRRCPANMWSCVFNRPPAARRSFAAIRCQALSRPNAIESASRSSQRRGRNLPARARAGGRCSRRQLAARKLHPAVGRAAGGAAQRRNRRDAGSGDAPRTGGGALDAAGLVAARGRDRRTSSFRRRSSPPHARAHPRPQLRLLQQARVARQDGRGLRRDRPPVAIGLRRGRRSHQRRTSTSAGRIASWQT